VQEHAGAAVAAGVAPDGPAAAGVLDRIVPRELDTAGRAALADGVATFTDARVERYWQLLAVLAGRPPVPAAVPAFAWLVAALRAQARPASPGAR
jgi:hypothetical protein